MVFRGGPAATTVALEKAVPRREAKDAAEPSENSLLYGSVILFGPRSTLLYDWCEERFEVQAAADDVLAKFVPPHVSIFYCFGGAVLTAFLFQAASGFALTAAYRPSVLEAFSSVQLVLRRAHAGWLLRSLHRWSSGAVVLLLLLHAARAYLTGGFKKPRELAWMTGVVLALATVSFGVTGYSLPWDQVGYWALEVVTSLPEALGKIVRGAGKISLLRLRGGAAVGQATLSRFYCLHTFVLPLLSLVLVLAHFSLLRKMGISGPL